MDNSYEAFIVEWYSYNWLSIRFPLNELLSFYLFRNRVKIWRVNVAGLEPAPPGNRPGLPFSPSDKTRLSTFRHSKRQFSNSDGVRKGVFWQEYLNCNFHYWMKYSDWKGINVWIFSFSLYFNPPPRAHPSHPRPWESRFTDWVTHLAHSELLSDGRPDEPGHAVVGAHVAHVQH